HLARADYTPSLSKVPLVSAIVSLKIYTNQTPVFFD
ncbi:MAG: hypothetical protein ACI92E_003212, partial [Oceanicoccus sp.]